MSDDSEYDAYNDFVDLTEEDFARLDTLSAPPPIWLQTVQTLENLVYGDPSLPSIAIEIEGHQKPADERVSQSPIRRFRRSGTLSVTDLIALAWCEVQFDYGLRQKRSRRLVDRPPSFRGATGKEIFVQQEVAARNDQTTKRGQFIHKELELELRPEDIEVVLTATEEERWALRLLNFLSSLVSLVVEGCAREIPVFGIVEGVVVVGIIDELLILDQPGPETGTKRTSDSSLPSPKRPCCAPSEAGASPPPAPTPPPLKCIRVIDTKTRRTYSLPSDEDTEPARLQVLLYHRLLTDLLDARLDFPALWRALRVDPSAPFSAEFLRQMADVMGASDSVRCLEEVVVLLRTRLAELGLPAVDGTVQIIYRSQDKYSSERRRGPKARTREDEDVAKAIEMSLAEVFDVELAAALKESASSVLEPSRVTPEVAPVASTSKSTGLQQEATILDFAAGEAPRPGSEQNLATPPKRPEIIGTKDFRVDDEALDAYLHGALEWWQGARAARGVSERQTARCYSCEYRNDCEWRESKAAEIRLRQGLRRAAS
ncbi:exonuclease V [Mycena filopes]|nr:exonuclease V [Mycena filopes]